MKITDISNNKAKEIIKGAPKEATHFSCIEGKTQYYKNETVISSLDEVFINVFRDIFQPSVFLLSDLENQMNIDKVETQTPETMQPRAKHFEVKEEVHLRDYQKETPTEHQEEMSTFSGAVWNNGDTCIADEYFGDELLTFVGMAHSLSYENDCVVIKNGNAVPMRVELLSKPETPQQREERERLEAAIELHDLAQDAYFACDGGRDGSATWDKSPERVKSMYFAIVDKTNYRKESN